MWNEGKDFGGRKIARAGGSGSEGVPPSNVGSQIHKDTPKWLLKHELNKENNIDMLKWIEESQ